MLRRCALDLALGHEQVALRHCIGRIASVARRKRQSKLVLHAPPRGCMFARCSSVGMERRHQTSIRSMSINMHSHLGLLYLSTSWCVSQTMSQANLSQEIEQAICDLGPKSGSGNQPLLYNGGSCPCFRVVQLNHMAN